MTTDYKAVLKKMMDEDQAMIRSIDKDPEIFKKQNKKHIKTLQKILSEIKEPRISILGYNGALTAWLVVQHADYDPNLQKDHLIMMKKLYEKSPDDVYKEGIAYLEDRILIKEKGKQLYGTQFRDSKLLKNTLEPYPVLYSKSPSNRRKKMGLLPMEEYIKELKQVYGQKVIYSDK